uniref:Uncharacterized protein n=4 Tax=Avena sativa TaxID=4498 RepID=A0ACD5WVH5_AVESA
MGTILDVLTSRFLTKLGHLIEEEVVMTLTVEKDIKRLKINLEHFSAVREDAEALAMEDRWVEAWWKNMSNVMFDIDVIIDLVMVHSHKLLLPPRSLGCNQASMVSCFGKLSFDHKVARRIKDINEKLDEIKMNTEMFSLDRITRQQFQVTAVDKNQTSSVDELEVVGREIKQSIDDMVHMIIGSCHENRSIVLGIHGMGGIGKTTLAQKIYNDQKIREKYQVHIWLCISQSYTETGLIKQAIRMAGQKCDNLETKTELLPLLVDTIKGKSVFLVLDDMWKSDVWIDLLQPIPEFVDKGRSTMHDLLRSLGQFLTKDHSLFMNVESIDAMSNLRRLGISHAVEELPALEEHKCLRSLLLFNNKNFKSVHKDIFRKLEHIRILVLSGTSIHKLPESLGNLVLLRLLDLSYTGINKLPESTGSLISLEYLSLLGCRQLDSLPAGLMRLSNISFLQLEQTAIDHVPKGIAKFQNLYNLRGVFESETGFRLEELRWLPNLHRLWVSKLEKAIPVGELILKNSCNLKELGLRCTMSESTHDRTRYEHDKVQIIQQVYDMLIPSPSLEYIFLVGFPGTMFPEWLRSKPELNMPSLQQMHLDECISCSELPPAGQMPQLQFLKIQGADAIETIGQELLGKEVTSPAAAAFFPKLEVLQLIGMRNLKSWSLNTGSPCDNMEGKSQQISVMPCLKRLLLLDCPKLRALPEDLSMVVNLKRIHIEGAHELREVIDLPAVVWLKVKNNTCLRRISNLGKLQDLFAQDCPALDQADSLCSLKRLYMVDCPHE